MIGTRVVEPFVFAKFLLDVGGGLVDGKNDGAGGGVGLLPDVDSIGGETHNYNLLISSGFVSTGPETPKPVKSGLAWMRKPHSSFKLQDVKCGVNSLKLECVRPFL